MVYICGMKKLNDFDVYEENPVNILSVDLKLFSPVKKGKVKHLQNLETGEQISVQELAKQESYFSDSREYRKIYVEDLSGIANLSSAGLRMWCYVLSRLPAKKDELQINISDAMDYTGYKTKANIYTGIVNLLENKMLFRKKNGYYININVFFNGKRKI